MSVKLGIISLGCDKNRVDTENLLAYAGDAGIEFTADENEADVILINTCAFIKKSQQEAIDTILEFVEKKKERDFKIIVTGCLPERYKQEIVDAIPEVDAFLGIGEYSKIADVIKSAREGKKVVDFTPCDLPSTKRVLTTPYHYAYLKIAEGCDNHCTYCAIPKIRGKFRSRTIESLYDEAKILVDEYGVKELNIVAQDITRYGMDWDGKPHLAELLEELCKLDFHWIRLHYLYPDSITDELIDTIAAEPKICNYMDIPIQHCNDDILRAMRRRETKAGLHQLFKKLRSRIPGLVLRTSIITGLPYEDEAAFEELCGFLQEEKIQRAGAFPYSPEEGTPAAKMLNRVDSDQAQSRAELIMQLQSQVMDQFNESRLGTTLEVLCDGFDPQAMAYVGRSWAESPGIDGVIYFTADRDVQPGQFVPVRITGIMDGDLTGEVTEEE